MAGFSQGDAFRFGWEKTKKHLAFLIGVMLLAGVVIFLLQMLMSVPMMFFVPKQDMMNFGQVPTGMDYSEYGQDQLIPNDVPMSEYPEDLKTQLGLRSSTDYSSIFSGEAGVATARMMAKAFAWMIPLWIVVTFVNMIIQMGFLKILFKLVDNQPTGFSDLFKSYPLIFKFLGNSIVTMFVVCLGMLLLVVPGVIWALKYGLGPYLVVDKGMGPIEAFKKSGDITKGSKGDLFLFFIVVGLLNMAGALLFGLGLFLTVPTSAFAMVYVYRTLLGEGKNMSAGGLDEATLEQLRG